MRLADSKHIINFFRPYDNILLHFVYSPIFSIWFLNNDVTKKRCWRQTCFVFWILGRLFILRTITPPTLKCIIVLNFGITSAQEAKNILLPSNNILLYLNLTSFLWFLGFTSRCESRFIRIAFLSSFKYWSSKRVDLSIRCVRRSQTSLQERVGYLLCRYGMFCVMLIFIFD